MDRLLGLADEYLLVASEKGSRFGLGLRELMVDGRLTLPRGGFALVLTDMARAPLEAALLFAGPEGRGGLPDGGFCSLLNFFLNIADRSICERFGASHFRIPASEPPLQRKGCNGTRTGWQEIRVRVRVRT